MRLRTNVIAFAALQLCLASIADALTLTRYPSVWLQTPTSILIAWETDVSSSGEVLFGVTPDLGSEASHTGSTSDHSVSLTGLTPSTQYYYRIVSGIDTLTTGGDTFRTAPVTTEPFRFLAFGDPGRATPEQIALAARIESLQPDLAILTGDIIYEAGEAANFTPQYFDIYRPTIARIPFYPCLGNHDVVTSNGQPYLDAFYLPANNPSSVERYYSFDYSNAHFAALEVTIENAAPSAAMRAWLDADLAATTKQWKFAFFHVPMYSNPGGHGGDAAIAASLEPILDARGVDIVFTGHNHFYTRTYPIAAGTIVNSSQEPNYANPAGPIYVVTGGAGRALYPLSGANAYEAFSKSTFHTTSVDVSGNVVSLAAVESDGTIFDSMTLFKDTPTGAETEREASRQGGSQGGLLMGSPHPNPSDGPTEIRFALDRAARVQVAIFDVAGRLIRTLQTSGTLGPGARTVLWDGRDRQGNGVPAGVYFVEIQAGSETARTRIVRLR